MSDPMAVGEGSLERAVQRVVEGITLGALILFLCLASTLLVAAPAWAEEEGAYDAASFIGEPLDAFELEGSLTYEIRFEEADSPDPMDPLVVSLKRGDVAMTELPTPADREGYRFCGWRTIVPSFTSHAPVTLEGGFVLEDLTWRLGSSSEEWPTGVADLRSYANEDHVIVLRALWQDAQTGRVEGMDGLGGLPRLRTSSSTCTTLYRYTNGYYHYLTTGSAAPSGFGSRTALCFVPTRSNTPVYALRYPGSAPQWIYTSAPGEISDLRSRGWEDKGLSFYADDACGLAIYRHYHSGTGAHGYYPTSSVSGWMREGVGFFALKWYSVSFDGNGADGGMMDPLEDLQYGLSYSLPPNAFERSDHRFAGWKTASGASFEDEQTIKDLTTIADGVVTLYAQWERVSCKVAFRGAGGEGIMEEEHIPLGEEYALPPCSFSKVAHLFEGWRGKDGELLEPGQRVLLDDDVEYEPSWRSMDVSFSIPATITLGLGANGRIVGPSYEGSSLGNDGDGTLRFAFEYEKPSSLSVCTHPKEMDELSLGILCADPCLIDLGDEDTVAPPWFVTQGRSAPVGIFKGKVKGLSSLADEYDLGKLHWSVSLALGSLTYDPNGNGEEPLVQQCNRDDRLAVIPCPFEREGFRFIGWNTSPDGQGEAFEPGDILDVAGDIHLYCQWEVI